MLFIVLINPLGWLGVAFWCGVAYDVIVVERDWLENGQLEKVVRTPHHQLCHQAAHLVSVLRGFACCHTSSCTYSFSCMHFVLRMHLTRP